MKVISEKELNKEIEYLEKQKQWNICIKIWIEAFKWIFSKHLNRY